MFFIRVFFFYLGYVLPVWFDPWLDTYASVYLPPGCLDYGGFSVNTYEVERALPDVSFGSED